MRTGVAKPRLRVIEVEGQSDSRPSPWMGEPCEEECGGLATEYEQGYKLMSG